MKSKTWLLFGGLILMSSLAACTTPTPYGPRMEGGTTGYTDERLAQNRYRVTFSGNAVTPRTAVEDYLLYRAAQVTIDSGYAAFEFDTRDTKAKTTYLSTFDTFPYGPGYRPFGWYWHNWAFDNVDVRSQPVTRYEAYAEIVMLTAEQAKSEPRSLDAHDVMSRLGPRVLPPPPK
ncbi:MAG TPA: hypothetical protein VLT91_10515 [Rhizomicrobium sp.]|nr:hypothetical protein [Rhizomicrobium sp.]